MKVYISIPITGRPIEEAKEHAEWLKSALEAHGHKCITPFEVCPEPDKPYAYYNFYNLTFPPPPHGSVALSPATHHAALARKAGFQACVSAAEPQPLR